MNRWLSNAIIAVAILVIAPASLMASIPFAKAVETRLFPVTEGMTFRQLPRTTPGSVSFSVTGKKTRNCTLLSIYVLSTIDGVPQRAFLTASAGPVDAEHSRPKGVQYFGIWSVQPEGDYIHFVAKHRCHTWWDTTTELGYIQIH